MNREIEARNEKLFTVTTVAGVRVTVLPLNGSADLFPKPWEDLSGLVDTLDQPVYQGGHVQLLNIDPRYIIEILKIKKPTPEDEAKLTAVLSRDATISVGQFNARRVTLSFGQTPMAAALVNLPGASATYRLPTRLLIITDLPRN